MNHRQRLATIIGCICALTGVTFVAFTAPASGVVIVPAHHSILSGDATCSEGDPSQHVILWSIGNSQPHMAMTIDSASAVFNGTNYSVDGATSPIPGGGATSATTTLDGSLTGTVTLVVSGSWADGHVATSSVDVGLGDPCAPVPTTEPPTTEPPTTEPPTTEPPTTEPPTTEPPTTAPVTTTPGTPTTGPTDTTTPNGVIPPTNHTPPPCDPATSVTHCKPLAYTGIGHMLGEVLVALGALLLGYGLLLPALRRRHTFAGR